jgi:acyl-CoA thioesterase
MPNADPLAAVKALMRRDRFARASGVRLAEVRDGYARTTLRLGPDHLNGVGVAQGGAIFTLADLAFAACCNSHGTVAVALDVTITFVRGLARGTLTAEAREISVSRRVSVCDVRVTDASGALVAAFKGTAFRKEEQAGELLRARPRAARRREPRGRAGLPRTVP